MATRYTDKDVENAFALLCQTAEKVGVKKPGEEWGLHQSCGTYRLFGNESGDTGTYELTFTTGTGYLGSTAREARETLIHYRYAWLAVLSAREETE